jgi:hypothetical protein
MALTLLLTWGSAPTWAQEQEYLNRSPAASAVKMVPEILVIRPLTGILALVPSAAFVATLPVTYPLGVSQKASTMLMEKPWEYVGNRPFGVFVLPPSMMAQSNKQIDQQYSEFPGRTGADGDLLNLR